MRTLMKSLSSLLALALISTAFAQYTEDNTKIFLKADKPQFEIRLKSNPTTGYSWFLKKFDSAYIEPLKHHFLASNNKKLIGAPGYEIWTFRAKAAAFKAPMQTSLHFVYVRPWEKNKESNELLFTVSTAKK